MPLAINALTVAINQMSKLATTTAEDVVTFTGASPDNPILIQVSSTVAWAFMDSSGVLGAKIPMAAGAVYNLRLTDGRAIYVQNQTTSGTLTVQRLA